MKGLCLLTILLALLSPHSKATATDAVILNRELGLCNNSVVAVVQDRHGYIWCATNDGLSRFDGRLFQTYRRPGHTTRQDALAGNALNCMLADPIEDWLWIGTQTDGLSRYDGSTGTFHTYRHPGQIPGNSITDIQPADDGSIWITDYRSGLARYNRQTDRFEPYDSKHVAGLVSDSVWCCIDDGQGHLYVGHAGNGLSVIDIRQHTARNLYHHKYATPLHPDGPCSEIGHNVYSLCLDDYGRLWLGTDEGLKVYLPRQQQLIDLSALCPEFKGKLRRVRQFHNAAQQPVLWVTTDYARLVNIPLHPSTPQLHNMQWNYLDAGELTYTSRNMHVNDVMQDRYGNHWVAMLQGGLVFLPRNGADLFAHTAYSPHPTDLSHLHSRAADGICFDSKGRMYVGSHGAGVGVYEGGKRIEVIGREQGLEYLDVQDVFVDADDQLWIATNGGALYLRRSPNDRCSTIFVDPEVRAVCQAPDGHIWAGVGFGAVEIDNRSGRCLRRLMLDKRFVWSLAIGPDGRLWMGCFRNGLQIMDLKSGQISSFNTTNGFPSDNINDIMVDGRGRVWLATTGAIVCFEDVLHHPTAYKVYGESHGLCDTNVEAIEIDHCGDCWFSTDYGIGCLRADGKVYAFDSSKGIPASSFCSGSSASHQGTIYFGSEDGYTSLRPSTFWGQRPTPEAFITGVCQIGVVTDSLFTAQGIIHLGCDNRIVLQYDDNSFSITFSTPDYAIHDDVEYAYRMRGFDSDWYITTAGEAFYRHLPAGDYTFQLRVRLKGGEWADSVAELPISVEPPLLLSWWMKCIYLLLILSVSGIILWFWRERVRFRRLTETLRQDFERRLKANQEQMEFYKNVSQGIRDIRAQHEENKQAVDNEFVAKVNRLIEKMIDNSQVDVENLSSEMGMSKSTLYRRMKSVLGMSAQDYIREMKMKRGRELLLSGRYTIAEVAYLLGYGSPVQFRKYFKEHYGQTPSEFLNTVSAPH